MLIQLNKRKYLIKIGKHIDSLLVNLTGDEARNWRYNFWSYVSHFNKLDAQKLFQKYNVIK